MLADFLLFIAVGLVCGFFSSAPIGPINLWIIDRVLVGYRFLQIFWFIFGVIVADVLLAAAAIWGYFAFFQERQFQRGLALIGGIVVLIMGVMIILRKNLHLPENRHLHNKISKLSHVKMFFTGLSFCSINPAFFTFWLVVISTIAEEFSSRPSGAVSWAFLMSIAVGDALWFWTVTFLAKKGVNLLRPRTSKTIRWIIGWIFVLIGVFILGRLAWTVVGSVS